MVNYLQDHTFRMLKSIGHAFFTREGGVSTGRHHSLNCAYASEDNPENVKENRQRAMVALNLPLDSLVTVKNVHGNQVAIVEKPWSEFQNPEADAMVTKLKRVVLGSDSADCPIVLFADEQAEVIGLAHAGWRGARNGVIDNTVQKMINIGANQHNISAVVSPCISQASYEVSNDFHQQFLLENSSNHIYFKDSNKATHFMFDLLGYVSDKLLKLNLKSVTAIGLDTYSNEDKFFSCRRSAHRGETDFGGHLSCIYLE